MSTPNELVVTVVGVVTVFLVFVILYALFKLFEFFGSSGRATKPVKAPKVVDGSVVTQREPKGVTSEASEFDLTEEIAAVFGAIYTLMGRDVQVKSVRAVKRVERTTLHRAGTREWVEWRTRGRRGGSRW